MKATLIFILVSLITGWRTSDERGVISPMSSKVPELDSSSLLASRPVDPEIKLNPDNHVGEYHLSNPETDMQLLMVPSITATKTYTLFGTDNVPVGPSPGDTLEYTVIISNNAGAMDATGVKFTDMIDLNTTLVAGSINTSPIAVDDLYSTVGNVSISVPMASGLLVNDVELDGDMITVDSVNVTGTQGDVTFASNGSFTFNPAPGFTGTTSFIYYISDGYFVRSGTVSITVTGMIWFIQAGAMAGGDGRLGTPFNSISSFNTNAVDDPNDNIFIYSGAYSGSIVLLNGQNIIGQGAVGTLAGLAGVTFSSFPPISPAVLPAVGGTSPTISNAFTTVTTAMNNDVLGITINNTGGTALTGNNLGTLKVREVIITNTAGIALNLSNGALDVILRTVSASAATYGIRLQTTTGSLEVTGTSTTDGSGGVFNNISTRGIELINATNITLRNLTMTNANTLDSGFDGICDEDDNILCNAAIYLRDINNITLNNVDITTTEEHGINGNNVTNLTIANCTSTSNGNHNEENALKLRNLLGTCSITGSTFSLSAFRIAHIINNTGTLNLTVNNCVFNNTVSSPVGADCFEMRTQGTATATANLMNSSFQRAASKGIQAFAEGSSTFNLNITNCSIQRFGGLMAGIEVGSVGTATMNYNIIGNPVIEASGEVGVLASTLNTSILNGRVNSNTSIAALPAAASAFSNIRVLHEGNSTSKIEIKNNPSVTSTNLEIPVIALARIGTVPNRLDLILDNNVVTDNTAGIEGIELRVGVSTTGTTINTICAHVLNNSVTVPNVLNQRAFRARVIEPSSFMNLQGPGPDVPTNWSSNMNTNSMGSIIVGFSQTPGNLTFGGICVPPAHPEPPPPPPAETDIAQHQNIQVIDTIVVLPDSLPQQKTSDTETSEIVPLFSMAGETIEVGGVSGFPLPQNKDITIVFQVEINDPFPDGICEVSNQGTVSGTNFSNVLTDDPGVMGLSNPTVTPVLRAPLINMCQTDINTTTDPDLCTSSVMFSSTATGCPAPTLSYQIGVTPITSPHIFDLESTMVMVVASNGIAPNDTCYFMVTVTDGQDPVLTCAVGTQMRNTDDGQCTYSVVGTEFDPMIVENCPGYTVTNDFNSMATLAGAILPEGMHSIEWTITDGAGLEDMCTVVIEVTDGEDPEITCPADASTECDINDLPPYANLMEFTNAGGSVTDNCGINNASFTYLGQTGGPAVYIRTYEIADINGHTATCMQTVTVEDMIPPMITTGTIASCYPTIALAESAAIGATTATDNCPGILDYSASTMGDCDATITVTVTDPAGNSAMTSYNTRIDNTPPMVMMGVIDASYSTIAAAEAAALAATTATDNCDGVLMESVSSVGECSLVITITITDGCGNNATAIYNTTIDIAGAIEGESTICEGETPGEIIETMMSTGSGILTYQWQGSTSGCNGMFSDIVDADETSYQPPSLSETTSYRRIVTSTVDMMSCNDTSNCVTITVNTVDAGTIGPDQIICNGDIPATLSAIIPADGAGTLTYQWQESHTGVLGSFSNIMGADNPDFSPPALTDTMYYRRYVTSQLNMVSCSDTSNTVVVIINNITAGAIAEDQVVCGGGDPEAIIEISPATASGTLSHQWQMSTNGCAGDFANIMDATGENYDPPALTVTTYYRRIDFSTIDAQVCSATTNCIMVIVNQIDAGEIGTAETICSGTAPMLLTSMANATGTNTPTYQWQESIVGCLSGFTDIDLATGATYQPPVLSQSTHYRRIAISTVGLLECRDTSNCIEITVRSINIESVVQECQDPSLYNLRICISYANPGPSGMFNVKVGMSDFGPYDYSALDMNGCLVIMDAGFDPTNEETFEVTVEDVDMLQSMLCSSTFNFMEGPCFQCPVIGSLTAPSSLCSTDQFALTASGLVFMAMAQNAEENFGIKFVAFPGGIPVNPYTGGIELGVVPFVSLSMGNTIAMLNNVNASLLGAPGLYTICAILSSAPDLDAECRPFQSQSVTLEAIPVIEGMISGPAVVCPDLENLPYSISSIGNATSYQWSFNNGNATISGDGNPEVDLSFNSIFNGGILSVTASNGCGTSIPEMLNIAKATAEFCQFTSCLAENQNLTIDQTLLNMMGSPDVYHAINNLESSATIEVLRTIIFKAGNQITLNPPFTVELGATFIAEIEACVYSIQRH